MKIPQRYNKDIDFGNKQHDYVSGPVIERKMTKEERDKYFPEDKKKAEGKRPIVPGRRNK